MIKQTTEVAKVALALPPRSRAKLAEQLLRSLDAPNQKEIDSLWADEAEGRIDAYERGEMKPVSAAEVMRKVRARKRS
jgi:putative addiction module component (TIGR02574 family)